MTQLQPNRDLRLSEALSILFDGLKIALSKECRLYIIIPIIINFLLLTGLSYLLITYVNQWINELTGGMPAIISALISGLLVISAVLAGCYFFSTFATLIASPFYGLLSDKVELKLTGKASSDDSLLYIIKSTPKIIMREVHKQLYFLPRALVCLIILFIPLLNIVSPILWFMLTSWMGCLQYCDYAYDNHKISFHDMRRDISTHRLHSFVFGMVITLLLTIPIFNLLVPPAAVCAGTKYYLRLQEVFKLQEVA